MYCSKCGTQIPEGSVFCTACGAMTGFQQQQGESAAPPAGEPSVAAPADSGATTKRSAPLIIAVAVVAAVMAIIAALLVVRFVLPTSVTIDEAAFPDATLRSAITAQADVDGDGVLSPDETRGITALVFQDVADFTGLDTAFPNLETLEVSGHTIPPLRFANLNNLKTLEVSGDGVSDVDVSGSKSLATLRVDGDSVASVNVSNAGSLQSLEVGGDSPTVDVTGAGSLTSLSVPEDSQVTGIETTKLEETWLPVRISSIDLDNSENWRAEIKRGADGKMMGLSTGMVRNGSLDASMTESHAYEYGDDGKLVRDEQWFGLFGDASARRVVTTYSYDDQGRCQLASGGGSSTSYHYDGQGRLQSIESSSVLDRAYSYDEAGNLVSTTFDNGSNSVYLWEYDDQGHVTSARLPYGTTNTYYTGSISYDDQGRVVSIAPAGADNIENIEGTYSYDSQGRLSGATGESVYIASARLNKLDSKVTYDEHGNPISIRTEYRDPTHLEPTHSGYDLEYARYFVSADAEVPHDVQVLPNCGAGGDASLIQPYIIPPSAVRASDALPASLDDQLFQQNWR